MAKQECTATYLDGRRPLKRDMRPVHGSRRSFDEGERSATQYMVVEFKKGNFIV